uniref:Failed axon connections homolog n=1 Tax=Crassostrea virginica TaxID=6565 RepID=A0A8B8DET9_CRAVI|nr:failed axon connections homolog [Crassostrea virginica]
MSSIETIRSILEAHVKEIGAVVLATAALLFVRKLRQAPRQVFPRDVVIHHQVGRGPFAPSIMPFAVKLETYLRMVKVPYKNVHDSYQHRSSKGKLTWIEYNGTQVADSEFSIKFINQTFDVDPDKHLTEEQQAMAYAMQVMVEEHTYWAVTLFRWVHERAEKINKYLGVPAILRYFLVEGLRKKCKAQGLGLHTPQEVRQIMAADLRTLQTFLGNKLFLLGDEPCKADCAIFGLLSQMYWQSFGGENETTIKEFPGLCSYCERMKARFWPDWDDCITQGGSKAATN